MSFALGTSGTAYSTIDGPYRWFLAERQGDRLERELADTLANTSTVLLLQDGRLLVGVSGTGPDGGEVFVLRSYKNARPDLLIWARDPLKAKDGKHLRNALSTLKFAD
jgi:hypothetical protein